MASIRTMEDLIRHTGERGDAVGRYRSVERPIPGFVTKPRPADHAVIDLEDGTKVFLEPLDSRKGLRSKAERARFEGKLVRVRGIAHRIMPSRGQSLAAPCMADITDISRVDE